MRKIIYLFVAIVVSCSCYAQSVTANFTGQNCIFDDEASYLNVNIYATGLNAQDPVGSGVTIQSVVNNISLNGLTIYSGNNMFSEYTNYSLYTSNAINNVQVIRTIYYSQSYVAGNGSIQSYNTSKTVSCSNVFQATVVPHPRILYAGTNVATGTIAVCAGDNYTLTNAVASGGNYTWAATGSELISGSTTSSSVNVISNGAGAVNLNWSINTSGCSLSRTVGVTVQNKSIVNSATSSTKTYAFVPNEVFIVSNVNGKGTLLKVKSANGSGSNMLALQGTGGNYSNLSGYSYLLGSQNFNSNITTLNFANGQTIIGFANGKLLKVNGTGGTGSNMFNITEISSGFQNGSTGTIYRLGDQVFQSAITAVTYGNSQLLIGFANGKLLKINGTGGTGFNMFNISEISSGFQNGSIGTIYRLGDQVFLAAVTTINNVTIGTQNQTLIGLASKNILGFNFAKLIKVLGTGGTGFNMFNITETINTVTSGSTGTTYLMGYQMFLSTINTVNNITVGGVNQTLIGCENGKLLKVIGTGGTGGSMLNVTENASTFTSNPNFTIYRIGEQVFSSAVTVVEYVNNQTFIGLSNGKLLKVTAAGGTGTNMLNVSENESGFTSNTAYTIYRIGDQIFQGKVTGVYFDGTQTYIGTNYAKLLKVTSTGGSGYNMFNVTENAAGFTTSSAAYTTYRIGDQLFKFIQCTGVDIVQIGKSLEIVQTTPEYNPTVKTNVTDLSVISVYPNPFTSSFTIRGLVENEKYAVMIVDIAGKIISNQELDLTNSTINLEDQLSGMYFVFIKNNDQTTKLKVIKQ